MMSWFFFSLLLGLWARDGQAGGLMPPQKVNLDADNAAQQLSVTWEGSQATSFDMEILRTELMEIVLNETVFVKLNLSTGRYQRNWTSPVPLECTSLSVKVRSRDGQDVSEWSPQQILPGKDLPYKAEAQMYPEVKVVPVGSNMTFCCIVAEGQQFGSMWYSQTRLNETMLSRRTYAATVTNQSLSKPSGTNVFCSNEKTTIKTADAGAVVFVGYPPLPSDLVCETHDLVSVSCAWTEGRKTYLYGTQRKTNYTLNGRACSIEKGPMQCGLDQWEGFWTLVAYNPLGQVRLTDAAELDHRVRPLAPVNLSPRVVQALNAIVEWRWSIEGYKTLSLICQVHLTNLWNNSTKTYTGVGLNSVVLKDLEPDEDYSARVRCGVQKNFWKWGEWSSALAFKTKMDRPDAPDVWVWMNSDDFGRVLWKPLTKRQSHGQITGYEVTLWSPEENIQQTVTLPRTTHSLPINGTDRGSTVMVTARNPAGVSRPASVVVPGQIPDEKEIPVSRVAFNGSGFSLSWAAHANASCGYVWEWYRTGCALDCSVEWTRVAPDNTSAVVQSSDFMSGVRYTLSVYACSSEAPRLLERWHGYMQELAPSMSVPGLSLDQKGSDVQLTWEQIPLEQQRGFILGYNVYLTHTSHPTLYANITDPQLTNLTVSHLSPGSYKFTVKAYTTAGEDEGVTGFISLKPYTDWLILEILVSLGVMTCLLTLISSLCYRKRKWVKKAFYPEIPEPKLPGSWGITQGTLDVKPSPHSMVHIVENPEWESSKEALVTVPEEDEDEDGDEPLALRYYNHVVGEGSTSGRHPYAFDSSASSIGSMDSGRTDVTYTGIQTSASSPVPPQPDASGPGRRVGGGGYQPQCSWKPDSSDAEDGGLDCMGSPTSVTSSQFLLPEDTSSPEGKENLSSATTWFHHFLTGKT
uniref:Fibronectin type-III domain-containing protein n=1 Tax=Esox lucius TaxID=8010 RepID=A0A3P8Z0K1_ESOLU